MKKTSTRRGRRAPARAGNPFASCTVAGYPLNPSVSQALGRALLPLLGFTPEEVSAALLSGANSR